MRRLYFVRHASPNIQPGVPTREWSLSDRGVEEARTLARTAAAWGLRALYSSSEQKACNTALIIGDALGLQVDVVDAFDELRIPEWVGNSDEFNELVRAVLEGRDYDPPRLDPLVEPRQVVALVVRGVDGLVAQQPEERRLLGVLLDDVGEDARHRVS